MAGPQSPTPTPYLVPVVQQGGDARAGCRAAEGGAPVPRGFPGVGRRTQRVVAAGLPEAQAPGRRGLVSGLLRPAETTAGLGAEASRGKRRGQGLLPAHLPAHTAARPRGLSASAASSPQAPRALTAAWPRASASRTAALTGPPRARGPLPAHLEMRRSPLNQKGVPTRHSPRWPSELGPPPPEQGQEFPLFEGACPRCWRGRPEPTRTGKDVSLLFCGNASWRPDCVQRQQGNAASRLTPRRSPSGPRRQTGSGLVPGRAPPLGPCSLGGRGRSRPRARDLPLETQGAR